MNLKKRTHRAVKMFHKLKAQHYRREHLLKITGSTVETLNELKEAVIKCRAKKYGP